MSAETARDSFLGIIPRTLMETLAIEVTEVSLDKVVATMPISSRVHQPYGILHGGASVALAETVASIGATVNIDTDRQQAVGLEINANHVRAKRTGTLTAVATPLHIGRTTQLWQVEMRDESDKLICVSRCTLAVVERRRSGTRASEARGPT